MTLRLAGALIDSDRTQIRHMDMRTTLIRALRALSGCGELDGYGTQGADIRCGNIPSVRCLILLVFTYLRIGHDIHSTAMRFSD